MVTKKSLFTLFTLLLLLLPLDAFATPPLRVGFLPNMTHAQALVGRERKIFEQKIGASIAWKSFNAGPSAMEALLAGQLDIAYVGPNPAVNAFMRSRGRALRIIAGAASGGAALIVPKESAISSAGDLRGKKVAAPERGNTQDVALRYWLKRQDLVIGRDIEVVSTKNPEIYTFFRQRQIAAAWVPEPWLTRLVHEAGGRILLDERTLWPQGKFPTTLLVVRAEFLQSDKEVVRRFLSAHLEAGEWISRNPREARGAINAQLKALTGKPLTDRVLESAFSRILLTHDPLAEQLLVSSGHAGELGYLPRESSFARARIREIFDLTLLNELLKERRMPLVK